MEANRILYKDIVDRHECTLRKSASSVYELVCSYFVVYFFILVCNSYESERLGKAVYGESVESVSFSWPIFVFTKHITPSYDCNQSVNISQRLPNSLNVARLLHKYAYSFVKYSQNVA